MKTLTGFLLWWLIFPGMISAQQILVMKNSKIISRFNPGDEIRFELKDQKKVTHHTYVGRIRDFDFITTNGDTIALNRISKLRFKNPGRRKYALAVAAAGVVLYGVYLLNKEAFSEDDGTSLKGLRFSALYGTGAAAFIFLTANSKIKLNGIKRLKAIRADSPLYRY